VPLLIKGKLRTELLVREKKIEKAFGIFENR
jgi:hypothetical protein